MSYRAAVHKTTGYTPAQLMFGREMRLPIDLIAGRPLGEDPQPTISEFARDMRDNLTKVHHYARDNLKLAGESMKRNYDRGAKDQRYAKGDRVWYYSPRLQKGQSSKLQMPWKGPYTIVEEISDIHYRIGHGPTKGEKVVHTNYLWRYAGPGSFTWTRSEDT